MMGVSRASNGVPLAEPSAAQRPTSMSNAPKASAMRETEKAGPPYDGIKLDPERKIFTFY
jgi:hypothetical protein